MVNKTIPGFKFIYFFADFNMEGTMDFNENLGSFVSHLLIPNL